MRNFDSPFISAIASAASAAIALIAVIVGYTKERSASKREHAKNILRHVYCPLLSYFIKQEAFRHIKEMPQELDPCEVPVFDLKYEDSQDFVDNMNSQVLTDVIKNIELSLAPTSLIILLNAYELAGKLEGRIKSDDEIKANLFKVNIEREIRSNVFSGFRYYRMLINSSKSDIFFKPFRKRKLEKDLDISNFATIKGTEILFKSKEPEEEIQKIKRDKDENPQNYE